METRPKLITPLQIGRAIATSSHQTSSLDMNTRALPAYAQFHRCRGRAWQKHPAGPGGGVDAMLMCPSWLASLIVALVMSLSAAAAAGASRFVGSNLARRLRYRREKRGTLPV